MNIFQRWIKWRQSQRWMYLGYTKLEYSKGELKGAHAGTVHFYVWEADQKRRKIDYSMAIQDPSYKNQEWYNETIVPWLEGGDMWKPIGHPVATKGSIINYVGNQPK